MSIKQNLFAALFLCTLTGHAFAATEIHKPDNNLEQLSKVSMSTHNSNPAGVESQIKEKAEELQASDYYISSFSGKNYIHATVIFYKESLCLTGAWNCSMLRCQNEIKNEKS